MNENITLKQDQEKPLIGIKGVFELSQKDIKILKETIEFNKGTIRVFIHPLYPVIYDEPRTTTMYEPRRGFKGQAVFLLNGFNKIIFSKNDRNVPIFIFEEKVNVSSLETAFSQDEFKGKILSNIIIIPTKKDNPMPDLSSSSVEGQKEWEWVDKFFEELGVKSITLGGANLAIGDTRKKGYPMMEQCVAEFIYMIDKDKFDLNLSHFTHPNDQKDLMRMYSERGNNDSDET